MSKGSWESRRMAMENSEWAKQLKSLTDVMLHATIRDETGMRQSRRTIAMEAADVKELVHEYGLGFLFLPIGTSLSAPYDENEDWDGREEFKPAELNLFVGDARPCIVELEAWDFDKGFINDPYEERLDLLFWHTNGIHYAAERMRLRSNQTLTDNRPSFHVDLVSPTYTHLRERAGYQWQHIPSLGVEETTRFVDLCRELYEHSYIEGSGLDEAD